MTSYAVGAPCVVLWDVGTPYGLAGEVTAQPWDVNVARMVDAGYGRYVEGDEMDGLLKPFGYEPTVNTLYLSKGADFSQVIELPTGSPIEFPTGTTARIDIVNPGTGAITTTWPGEVTPYSLMFEVQATLTDTVPNGYRYRLYVVFPTTPSRDILWYYGKIERKE